MQTPNLQTPKEGRMEARKRDLEERTAGFAGRVRDFARKLPRTITNDEDVRQLARSSGSVAANCIEGNEAVGTKDRVFKFRICRKEAKESQLWLALLDTGGATELAHAQSELRQEAHELKLIFTAIIKKLEYRSIWRLARDPSGWFCGFVWRLAFWRLDFVTPCAR